VRIAGDRDLLIAPKTAVTLPSARKEALIARQP